MKRIRINLMQLVPRKYRRATYVLLALASLVAAAYQANDGDWGQTLAYLGSTLVGYMAQANATDDVDQLDRPRRR